jgi:peptide/nickel transport system substrate-binding protein
MWPAHQLFNTLIEVDDSLKLQPSLATRWEISQDRLKLIFHLRTDVLFHDDGCFVNSKGRRLVAADVVYSFQRIIDKNTASPGAWIFNGHIDSLIPFTAIDDSTFQIKLLKPFHPILGILTMPYCSIVPKEAVEKYGSDFRKHPVGTGPFAFLAWEEGQALVLKRNPNYFEKDNSGIRLPYLSGVKVTFNQSKAAEFLEFQQHRLDFINDVDPSFKDELLTRKGNLRKEWLNKLQLFKSPYLNVEYLGILMDTSDALLNASPMRMLAFRKAMSYAIDRQKLVFYLRNSIGVPAEQGFVPPGLPGGGNVTGYHYDPIMARKLLREAGIISDSINVIKLVTVPAYANLGTYIVSQLNLCGIPAQVDVVQKSLLLEQMAKSQVLFFRGSWIADYPDAENYLSVFYGNNPAPPNYTRFQNAEYDKLYETAIAEENDSLRNLLYSKMDEIIMQQAPVIPLWYDMVLHLVQNDVKGFSSNKRNMLELRRVRKMKE